MVKKALHILLVILAVLLLLNVILLITLNTPSVQERLVRKVTNVISEKTGTEISIGHIQIDIFNGLYAGQVFIEDSRQDTLLFVDQLQVDFSLWKLYRTNKIRLKKVVLSDFLIRLTKESDSSCYNYQFLIDAFSSHDTIPDDTIPSKFQLVINDIQLQNGRFQHDLLSEPDTSRLFNFNHLRVDSIYSSVKLDLSLPTHLTADVSHFSAKEKSGLLIRDINTDVLFQLDSIALSINELLVQSRKTNLSAHNILYDIKHDKIQASIDEFHIIGSDFSCFADFLKRIDDTLTCKAKVNLQLPQITIDSLSSQFSQSIQLNATKLCIDDYEHWDSCLYVIKELQLTALHGASHSIEQDFGLGLPAIVDSLFPATLLCDAEGTLPDFSEKIHLTSSVGTIYTAGTLHYLHAKSEVSADNNWLLHLSSLRPITQSDIVEGGKSILDTHVKWNLDENPNIALSAVIDSLTLMNHTYDTLHLHLSYDNEDHLATQLTSSDSCLHLSLNANIDHLLKDNMETHISTNISNILPYPLHLLDTLQNLCIKGKMQLDGNGMDIDTWKGTISIDSLLLKNDSFSLTYNHIQVVQSYTNPIKKTTLSSPILSGSIAGDYHFSQLPFSSIFHSYLPTLFKTGGDTAAGNLTFHFDIKNLDETAKFLNLPLSNSGTTVAEGSVDTRDNLISLYIQSPSIAYDSYQFDSADLHFSSDGKHLTGSLSSLFYPDKTDTFAAKIHADFDIHNDSINNRIYCQTEPDSNFLKGDISDCISFRTIGDTAYNIIADIQPSTIQINKQPILLRPASATIASNDIQIRNFGLEMNDKLVFLANGTLSDRISDTLDITVENLQLNTILSLLLINDVPANCYFSGNLQSAALLGEQSRFFTRNFHADSITYQNLHIGDLSMKAVWDNAKGGVFAKMDVVRDQQHLMDIKGVVSPAKQFIKLKAQLDSIPLVLAMPFASDYVSDLDGQLASNITIEGNLSSPDIKGSIHLLGAKAKVNYTGVTYTISDSITLQGNYFYAKKFKIKDGKGNTLTLDGEITHHQFQAFDYKLKLDMRNFALLDNPKSHDKMAYGTFSVNGSNLLLKGTEKEASITGNLSNSEGCILNIVLPESVTEAYSNDNIVYVQAETTAKTDTVHRDTTNAFHLSADLNIGLSDKAAFNVNVADGAMIKGNGNLRLTYDDGDIALYNRFTVTDGYMKLRLSGLPTKKFSIQEGSYVEFNGDPMGLKFNATASYGLTADLSTLSSSFSSLGLGSTRVPVSCDLTASGNLDNLSLAYNVSLPKADENIKQSVSSIINTDNIRIKEFAYLIGLGMFNDPSGQVESDALMSFASSSLSSTLNNVLGDVLKDKLTVGADVNSAQDDLSDVEVSVSVSTKLFNDRLLLSTNLGYQNQANNSSNSFLGDFDAEYLLGKTGMFRIKGYNHTNNDFYRASNNTQGIGFSYVRESKTLKSLFRAKRERRKKNEKDENQNSDHR